MDELTRSDRVLSTKQQSGYEEISVGKRQEFFKKVQNNCHHTEELTFLSVKFSFDRAHIMCVKEMMPEVS